MESVLVAPSFALIRYSFLLGNDLLNSSRTFSLHYTMLHMLASTSLLLNTAVGYQSLSTLYYKRSLLNKFLANSLAVSERVFRISLYFTVITIDTIVMFGVNSMRNIMLSVFRLL